MPHDPIEKQRLYYAQIAASYNSAFAFDPEDEQFSPALSSPVARAITTLNGMVCSIPSP